MEELEEELLIYWSQQSRVSNIKWEILMLLNLI